MVYRYGLLLIDMVIDHDMVILDIDMADEANDMGDDSIDMVISHIDMGYLVTLAPPPRPCQTPPRRRVLQKKHSTDIEA